MTSLEWNYKGVFPKGAESAGSFWGYRGIKSYAGSPFPSGTLTGQTAVTTPALDIITCHAVNTIAYSWQKSTDGSTWTDIADEHKSTLDASFSLGSHGEYWYRCICYGWLGNTTTDALKVTVTEPSISTYLTASETEIAYGASTTISCFITPYPAYAKSFKWQTSTDGETWTDMAESTREHTFTGTTVGSHYFRVIATQYDDVTVTSNALEITVEAPAITVTLSASETEIAVGETSTLTGSISPSQSYAKSFRWEQSSDGTEWTTLAESTLEHTFTGETAGTTYFRIVGVKLDDTEVTSASVSITVTEEE